MTDRTTVAPAMFPGERTDHYMRRSGAYPPHWTSDECAVFDAKAESYREVAGRGITTADREAGRRWLRRHGIDR